MKKTELLAFKTTPQIKEIIEKLSRDDERTTSAMLNRIVRQWLEQHGHLKPDKVKK